MTFYLNKEEKKKTLISLKVSDRQSQQTVFQTLLKCV